MSVLSSISSAIQGIVGGAVKPVLDKFVGDKMSDAEKAAFELELKKAVAEETANQEERFYNFVIEHSGKASDMPRSVQIVRGMIRPTITLTGFGALIWVLYNFMFLTWPATMQAPNMEFALKVIFGINLLTLSFWFGDKFLQRSGLTEVLLSRSNNKKLVRY